MRGFSKAIITGNLTRDPETRSTTNGTSVCSFSVAVNRRYTNKNGEQQDEVSYFNCSAWGRTGETIQQYAHKGDAILVSGRLRQDRWEDKDTGKTRSSVEIVVEEFNFLGSGNSADDAAAPTTKKSTSKKSNSKKADDEVIPDDIPEGEISLDEVPF